jgi:hypothetical protein
MATLNLNNNLNKAKRTRSLLVYSQIRAGFYMYLSERPPQPYTADAFVSINPPGVDDKPVNLYEIHQVGLRESGGRWATEGCNIDTSAVSVMCDLMSVADADNVPFNSGWNIYFRADANGNVDSGSGVGNF